MILSTVEIEVLKAIDDLKLRDPNKSEIRERVLQLRQRVIEVPVLDSALHAMERRGVIASWEEKGKDRVYWLTELGRKTLTTR